MNPDIERRLEAIEQRLTKLEGLRPEPPRPKPTTPSPAQQQVARPPSTRSVAPPVKTKPGNWLGIIGIICFVLAAAFIIKLSIESGWLTPERQVGMAILFGLGLIGAGFALLHKDRDYASLLPGAGVIVLYLSVFAAHSWYLILPFEAALAATSLVSAVCIWLYTRIEHDVYPVTAAVGSYVAPIIFGLNSVTDFSLYYFVLCSVSFAIISIWVQSRTLTVVSAYLSILATSLVGGKLYNDSLVAGILALHFIIFTFGTFLYTKHTQKALTREEAFSFLPVLVIFYVCEYATLSKINADLAPWISLGFAAVLLGVYFSAEKMMSKETLNSRPVILAFTTLVLFHSLYWELLPKDFKPWLFSVIMVAAAFAPTMSSKNANAFKIPMLGVLAILMIEFCQIMSHVTTGQDQYWVVLALVSAASTWVMLTVGQDKTKDNEEAKFALLGAAHLLAVLGFYRLTQSVGSLAVSASWLVYALLVIGFASTRKDVVMAKSALFVLGFAAAKALLYDVSNAAPVVRIFCLLLTGAVLYGSGFLVRKIASWKT